MAMENALLVIVGYFGVMVIAVMELADNIRPLNMTRETTPSNVSGATDSKEESKPSTKKKLKKGTVRGHGMHLSSKAARSAKGGKSK